MILPKRFYMAVAFVVSNWRAIFFSRARYGLWLTAVLLPRVACAQFSDTFDTIDPTWATDRYAPAEFQVASFLGDNRLQITIDQSGSTLNRPVINSSAFYNTQGESRPGNILGSWSISAEVYVASAFNTTTGQLVRSDLWVHTGTTSTDGDYAIIGFSNASPTDPLNPAAADRTFRFRIFDGTDPEPPGWFDVGVSPGFVFDAWHNLEISYRNLQTQYLLDGVVVYIDPTTDGANLQTASIEAYNFGQTDSGGLNSYSVYWDNAFAVVPKPATTALIAGLVMLVLAGSQRALYRP